MSHNLSQPEEVEFVLREMRRNETPMAGDGRYNFDLQDDWSGSYVSPYRAAHMRAPHMNLSSIHHISNL